MLKGIVNGVEKDITRIPMKGKNLAYANSDRTGSFLTWQKDKSTFTLNGSPSAADSLPFSTFDLKAGTYTLSIHGLKEIGREKTGLYLSGVDTVRVQTNRTYTITKDTTVTLRLVISVSDVSYDNEEITVMFNTGSTALPYEPYGYQEGWEVRDNQDRLIWGRENIFEGTDSISFKGYGVPISTIEVDGNGQQNGTPTSDNPIIPEFCGDRTDNLSQWEKGGINTTTGADEVYRTAAQGGTCEQMRSLYIPCSGNTTYVLHTNHYPVQTFISYYDADKIYISRSSGTPQGENRMFTTPETARYMRAQLAHVTADQVYPAIEENQQYAITLGSTALPYEPYGYKIPFTCNEQTVPVYLGEVPTIRRIKKLVFDGTENWNVFEGTNRFFYVPLNPKCAGTTSSYFLCTHRTGLQAPSTRDSLRWYDNNTDWSDVASFKAWITDQYTAGTPVTVWYVLATPETGIVNEPLCKIGDYYDTLTLTNQDVNINISNGACLLKVNTELPPSKLTIKAHVKSATNWNQFRNYIRNGYGPIMYPVGTILYDNFGTETGTAYRVVAYDKHFDPSLTAQGYNHSVTLCEELLEDIYPFDNAEAMLYVETAIPAGTYKFTIPNYDAAYGGNKTYYFTSTANVPVDSQIVLRWDYRHPPQSVTAYVGPNPQTKTTALTGFNGLTLTEWVEGESPDAIDLGTVGGPTTQLGTSNYGQMNHIQRARYGSNNYLQSGVRQYINSSTASNTWWQPQTVFDRPYSQRTQNGKLMKLNQDMVSVLAKPEIQSRTNQYFETTSLNGTTFELNTNYTITTDRMFLLSPMEVGFTTTDTTVGTTLDYYIDTTNDKRIKYRKSNNTAYYWWLRTLHPTYTYSVRYVFSTGALGYSGAGDSYGVAPACIIQ